MTLFWIILANLLISLLSLIGLLVFTKTKTSNRKLTSLFVSFSAGVLLAAAFLNMLAEALHDGDAEEVLFYALMGIVIGFFMERFLLWYHHHHENTHNLHPTALLVLLGDGVHNVIDGIAIAASFMVSPLLGFTTTMAVAAHEIPQEFADFMILLHTGLKKKKALFYNFLSALLAVVGGIAGYYFLQSFEHTLPFALAITAGIFIYIAAADLIPELHEDTDSHHPMLQALPFLLGVLLIYFLTEYFSHGH